MLSNDADHAASRRRVANVVAIPVGHEAPAAARSFIARHVADAAPDVLDAALLLVSELVTNSVCHSSAAGDEAVIVRVRVRPGECWLEVEDAGDGGVIAPQAQGPGLGLLLVERLSDQWGVTRGAEGPTRVWVRLATAGTAVVERVSVYASPDPHADVEVAEARRRAHRGDGSWAEWLHDLNAGRALVALLEIEVRLTVEGAKRRVRGKTPGVWLELETHPPLVERQVQEAATVSLSTLGAAIEMPLGVHMPELASMSVHVELDDAIRERLPR
jgi:serine/threonine-protein kinase RsbW